MANKFLIGELEQKVRELLFQGLDKQEVYERLVTSENKEELIYLLNNLPAPEPRRKYLYLNIILISMLGIITARKLFDLWGIEYFNIFTIFSFVVPTINIYLMREIMLFHRTGFQFTAILMAISLFNAENRGIPEIVFIPIMVAISGFLYFKLYPANAMIRDDS